MISLLILPLLATLALSKPDPCTTPAQWEALTLREDEKNAYTARVQVSYDATNKRERYLTVNVFGQLDYTDTLYLYQQNVYYVYDLKTKVCTKNSLTSSWIDFGVPQGSQFAGEVYVGAAAVPGVNILASTWSHTYPNPGDPIAYFGMFSEPTCLPLTVGYQSEGLGRLTVNFFDITPGIKDPSVFTPRPECLNL